MASSDLKIDIEVKVAARDPRNEREARLVMLDFARRALYRSDALSIGSTFERPARNADRVQEMRSQRAARRTLLRLALAWIIGAVAGSALATFPVVQLIRHAS